MTRSAFAPSHSEPITATMLHAARRMLAERRYEFTLLDSILQRAQTAGHLRKRIFFATGSDGKPAAVIAGGPCTVLSGGVPAAFEELGRLPTARRPIKALIGPSDSIEAYLRGVSPRSKPTAGYLHDIHFIERRMITPNVDRPLVVRRAACKDIDVVRDGAGTMILDELGYDPRSRPTFLQEIESQILAGRWWIAHDRSLRLLCRVGAATAYAAQLECIWSPPVSRGEGYATAALAGICRLLLQTTPVLTLGVASTNTAAVALYTRLGFQRIGTQRTLLW